MNYKKENEFITVLDIVENNKKNLNVLTYKGFYTIVKYSEVDSVYHGKIEEIKDMVSFEGDLDNIQKSFEDAVEDYLEICKDLNEEPINSVSLLLSKNASLEFTNMLLKTDNDTLKEKERTISLEELEQQLKDKYR